MRLELALISVASALAELPDDDRFSSAAAEADYDAMLRRQEELYKRTGTTVESMIVALRYKKMSLINTRILEDQWRQDLAGVCGEKDERCMVGAGETGMPGTGGPSGSIDVRIFDESAAAAVQDFVMEQPETISVKWRDMTTRSPHEKKRQAKEAREKIRLAREKAEQEANLAEARAAAKKAREERDEL